MILCFKWFVANECKLNFQRMFSLYVFFFSVRFMNVLIDDIIEYREFPMKGCRYVRFSNGGQYFAAVNSGSIQIYNTYSCHNIANLRGHTGKVNYFIIESISQKSLVCFLCLIWQFVNTKCFCLTNVVF